jgi:FMN-dependent NADH-azoreductase
LIAELKSANQLLISSPLYNLNVPSSLKAYFDHVVRGGHTFSMDENGYTGLLAGKSAVVITARGGQASSSVEDDYQTPFLKSILKFIGFDAVEGVSLEGTGDGNGAITEVMTRARRKVDLMFDVQSVATQPAEPQWLGAFTAEDREEIAALRAGQATAIQNRDAEAYARLCADDIQLMVPGHDIVSGRQHLLDWETKIFRGAHFASFKKTALRVERSGDIAVEIGRQELVTSEGSNATGVFASRQKYSHVFRKTAQGWRFIVLMSNSNA